MNTRVAVEASADTAQDVVAMAQRLNLDLVAPGSETIAFLLQLRNGRWQLQQTGARAPGPVFVDFISGKAAYRRHQGEGRKTPLARALGMKADFTPRVVDGTAGLGQDAFVLATLGCQVTLIEQSPIIHALLADGLARAAEDDLVRPIVERMSLIQANTIDYLQQLPPEQYPDAIYLDPMYPHRGKNALSKKEMQSFQKLLGEDRQGAEMLNIARQRVRKRVAVKRPVKAGFLGDETADFQILRPKIRFDVYLRKL